MCGIIAAATEKSVGKLLVQGLYKMEYRGYDSAGVALHQIDDIAHLRSLGKVKKLESKMVKEKPKGKIGIAHTRWATHGVPSEKNAHPHNSKDIYVVHNGIIENHQDLRAKLEAKGIKFYSQTDTEVIAHLIQNHLEKGKSFEQAVIEASRELKGAYALGIINKKDPEQLIGVRSQSPLVVGKGFQENFIASDVMALAPVTNQFIYLEDGQLAFLSKEKVTVKNIKNKIVRAKTHEVDSNSYTTDLAGHNHFMEKEIFEQPRAVKDAIEGRLTNKESQEGIFGAGFEKEIKDITNIQIVACGTSYHSARIFEFWSHKFLGINCRVDYGSEYQYQEPIKTDKTLLVTISQSGETADTLSSLKFAKKTGKPLSLAICNVANSSICRESDYTLLTNAGPEIGVASTKAFVTQLACLNLLLLTLMRVHNKMPGGRAKIAKALLELPNQIKKTLKQTEDYKKVAKQLFKKNSTLFLGRGLYYPIAREGALKLKEISYIHAEAYPGGELKHGPLALIDKDMPVIALVPDNEHLDKITSNIEEVAARRGKVFTIGPLKKTKIDKEGGHIKIPKTLDLLNPIISVVPMQLIAYHTAILKGTDVDKPRNLAKSVTVE